MRQVVITVPSDRSDQIVRVLQDNCALASVFRHSEDGISSIFAYAHPSVTSNILHELDKAGCGVAYGRIALLPVEVLKPLPRSTNAYDKAAESVTKVESAARLAIEEIYSEIAEACSLSFDYIAFIVVASLVAGLGLATNNTVMIVASMLVSPLMSPILAFTFGTAVRDTALITKGIIVEVVGIMITFFVGMVVGLIFAPFADEFEWPTNEMSSRGDATGLLVGLAFAVPSGAGVALSVTGGGGNALVGVAIAASLLPPVVNSGMCLTFGLLSSRWVGGGWDRSHFYEISWISLSLFLLNVVCIWMVALVFFAMKRIRPVRRQLSAWEELPRIKTKVKQIQEQKQRAAAIAAGGDGTSASAPAAALLTALNGSVIPPGSPPFGPTNAPTEMPVAPTSVAGSEDEAALELAKLTWESLKTDEAVTAEETENKLKKPEKGKKDKETAEYKEEGGEEEEKALMAVKSGAARKSGGAPLVGVAPPTVDALRAAAVAGGATNGSLLLSTSLGGAAATDLHDDAADLKAASDQAAASVAAAGQWRADDALGGSGVHRAMARGRWKMLRAVVKELRREGALAALGAGGMEPSREERAAMAEVAAATTSPRGPLGAAAYIIGAVGGAIFRRGRPAGTDDSPFEIGRGNPAAPPAAPSAPPPGGRPAQRRDPPPALRI